MPPHHGIVQFWNNSTDCASSKWHVQVKRYLEDNFRNREGRPIEIETKHCWLVEYDNTLPLLRWWEVFQKLSLSNKNVKRTAPSGSPWPRIKPNLLVSITHGRICFLYWNSKIVQNHSALAPSESGCPTHFKTVPTTVPTSGTCNFAIGTKNELFEIKAKANFVSFWNQVNFILWSETSNVELVLALPFTCLTVIWRVGDIVFFNIYQFFLC